MSTPEVPGPHEPVWHPEDHLDRVFQRGRRLRLRRRMGAWVGATLAAVVVVAGVAAAVGGGTNSGRRVVTAGSGRPAGTATTTLAAGAGAGAGATLQPTSTTAPGGGNPASGAGPSASTSTTAKTRGTTSSSPTTVRPITTVPATTTTTGAGGPACATGELHYSTTTDATTYAAPATVAFTLVVTNVSGRTCNGPSYSGISAVATVTDQSGTVVHTTSPIGISCTFSCTPPLLRPGGSAPYSAGEWAGAPAGTYRAAASRLNATGSAASFTVR